MATINPTTVSCPPEPFTNKHAYLKLTITSITDSDAETNERYISWKVTIEGTSWVQLTGRYVKLGNIEIVPKNTTLISNWSVGHITDQGTTTYQNDSSGNLTLNAYIKQLFYYGYGDDRWEMPNRYQDVSQDLVCSQLLRYATFTNISTSSSIDNINAWYTVDVPYDTPEYKFNGSPWLSGNFGGYNIYINQPNTTFTLQLRVRRTDSGLYTESDVLSIKTKPLPTSIAPGDIEFNGSSGNKIVPSISSMDYLVNWYVDVYDGQTLVKSFSNNKSTTASKEYNLSSSDFTSMLSRHSSDNYWNLTIKYYVSTNDHTYTLTDRTCRCTIPNGQYTPTYNTNNISYAVIDSKTLNLNNNNATKVIKGVSNVRVSSTAATANGSSSISAYSFVSGTKSGSVNVNSQTTYPINVDLTAVDGDSVSAQAIDSRGRSTVVTKTYAAFIDYYSPRITSGSAVRNDAIGTNVIVNISGIYCNWSGLATNNTVEQVSIQYKIKGAGSWTTKTGITLTRTVGSGNFSFSGTITGDNFVATNEYELKITLQDKIGTFEFLADIPVGKSLLWRDLTNNRIGIGKKPGQTLDVNGNIACSNLYGNVYPNYLNDSTYNSSGNIKLYDRTYLDCINANRSMFFPGANVVLERSTDGGSTWSEISRDSYSNSARTALFSGTRPGGVNICATTPVTTNMKCRVTLNSPGSGWYCSLDRIFIFFNTAGHTVYLDAEYSTYGSQSTYQTLFSNKQVSGWSGPNLISFGSKTAWGTNNSAHIYNIRLIFKIITVNSSYTTTSPSFNDIRFFGQNYWGSSGQPRYNGHLYTWDQSQNVTFPAKVTSSTMSATTITATNLQISGTNVLEKIYPVGSIYLSIKATNPNTLFGFGTWTQIKNAYLFATNSTSGDAGTVTGSGKDTGSHILTADEIPTHKHDTWKRDPNASSSASYTAMIDTNGTGASHQGWKPTLSSGTNKTMETSETGGGQGHTHTIANVEVYVWKRTA